MEVSLKQVKDLKAGHEILHPSSQVENPVVADDPVIEDRDGEEVAKVQFRPREGEEDGASMECPPDTEVQVVV
jgi:hypothetical protein